MHSFAYGMCLRAHQRVNPPYAHNTLVPAGFCLRHFYHHKKYFRFFRVPFFRRPDSVKTSAYNPQPLNYPPDSWPYFLQHLPAEHKPIVDYKGNLIGNQEKHFAVLSFDIGNADLQQCADALMRIRAEYLFSRMKYTEIGFHFNNGIFYSWTDYLNGLRPILKNRKIILGHAAAASVISHSSLRKYLDIVYAYANTVSLCRELKYTNRLETGTVIYIRVTPVTVV